MPPNLKGLTERQVELLDTMWSFDELEEFLEWKRQLARAEQRECDRLMDMVLADLADQIIVDDLTQARKVLDKFRL